MNTEAKAFQEWINKIDSKSIEHVKITDLGFCPNSALYRLFDHGFVIDSAPIWCKELNGNEYAIVSRTYLNDQEIDQELEGLKTIRLPAECMAGMPGTPIATVMTGPGPFAADFIQFCSELPAKYISHILPSNNEYGIYASYDGKFGTDFELVLVEE